MVELRRLDEDFQVLLEPGGTTLGRGPLLQIEATNISRKHAQLSIGENSDIKLTCLHKNPIFIKKRGVWCELAKDEEVMMENEDEVKFLADSFHFKVYLPGSRNDVTATSEKSDEHGQDNDDPAQRDAQVLPSPQASKKRKLPEWMSISPSKKLQKQSTDNDMVLSEHKECMNDHEEANGASSSVSSDLVAPVDASLPSTSKPVRTPMKDAPAKIKESCSPNKQEDGVTTVFPVLVTPRDILGSDNEDEKENLKKKNTLRPSCAFGNSCYRKNPVHRVEEAHPGDDDYKDPSEAVSDDDGDDDRPECEFGTDCYRKNPDHRKQFKHSIRPQPKRGAKVIVTKKKKVKAAKKKKGLDDYESEDSFIDDDEEDDWSPVDDSDDDEDWAPKMSPEYEDE